MVEIFQTILLAVLAFGLGACPFSVWIGRWLVHRDIRAYGDSNPGAINVFRAGGHKSGILAATLDVAKGVPFVVITYAVLGLPEPSVVVVGLSSILGHAFSPFLGWRGGKALSVTAGVFIAMPQHEIIFAFIAFMVLGFLFIEVDAWTAMLGITGTLAYVVVTSGRSWESLFMLCVLIILSFKHFEELHTMPAGKGRLINWLQSRRREG